MILFRAWEYFEHFLNGFWSPQVRKRIRINRTQLFVEMMQSQNISTYRLIFDDLIVNKS